jgi:hypothetical protein
MSLLESVAGFTTTAAAQATKGVVEAASANIVDPYELDKELRLEYQDIQRQATSMNIRKQQAMRKRAERIRRATVRQAAFGSGVAGSSSETGYLSNIRTQGSADSAFQSANLLFADVMTEHLQDIADAGVAIQRREESIRQQEAVGQFLFDLGLNVGKAVAGA